MGIIQKMKKKKLEKIMKSFDKEWTDGRGKKNE